MAQVQDLQPRGRPHPGLWDPRPVSLILVMAGRESLQCRVSDLDRHKFASHPDRLGMYGVLELLRILRIKKADPDAAIRFLSSRVQQHAPPNSLQYIIFCFLNQVSSKTIGHRIHSRTDESCGVWAQVTWEGYGAF